MTEDFAARELCTDGACIGVIGADGRCRECGRPGESVTVNPRNRGMLHPEAEPPGFEDERYLCADPTCVGIIGDDGLCRECGLEAQASDSPDEAEATAESEDASDTVETGDETDDETEASAAPSDDIETRTLCPDGACIGVIDAKGFCRECGRPAG